MNRKVKRSSSASKTGPEEIAACGCWSDICAGRRRRRGGDGPVLAGARLLDKEQASLLYLPVVVACATRFGFGPAVLVAVGSFVCWNFFFLPPFGTWAVQDPKDWLALIIFLAVALATARLSAQARAQTREAQAREREARVLQRASEEISGEVETERILPVLARQLVRTCAADYCLIYRVIRADASDLKLMAAYP